jgi:hypothetical protein
MNDQKRFEVVVYNREVRDLVARHERHKDLKDAWAENHYQEVRATSADDARRKVEIRHPAHKGFVVEAVREIQVYDDDDDVA